MSEDNPSKTVPDGQGVSPTEGSENANSPSISLKDLAEATGKTFQKPEDAIKAIKDTKDYVGKVGKYQPYIEKLEAKHGGEKGVQKFMEDVLNGAQPQAQQPQAQQAQPQVDSSKFVSREQYETDTFYAQHPELQPFRTVIDSVKQSTGKPLTEVVTLPDVKGLVEKASKFDEQEKSKSVLHTNPRLGSAVTKLEEAQEAHSKGDVATATTKAVDAVLEAFEK